MANGNANNVYHIIVRGKLDQHWTTWFDNFKLSYIKGDTLLIGSVNDQAALHGILSKIRDLGLIIVRIELVS